MHLASRKKVQWYPSLSDGGPESGRMGLGGVSGIDAFFSSVRRLSRQG